MRGPETVFASTWGPRREGVSASRAVEEVDGLVVVQHLDDSFDDGTQFRAVNVFILDPETRDVLCYAFDSFGFPPDPPAQGSWQGHDLVLERTSPRGTARMVFTPGPSGYAWRKEFRAPGVAEWQPVAMAKLSPTSERLDVATAI
jgi:hypothetical protein